MTSTPVSLKDESLNGSWIDINSASQIHSPMDDDSPELLRPPYSLAESVQSLGLISFQVERFLQEAQRNQQQQNLTNSQQNLSQQQQQPNHNYSQQQMPDNISDLYLSDTDASIDSPEGKAMISSLWKHHKERSLATVAAASSGNVGNNTGISEQLSSKNINATTNNISTGQIFSKSGEYLADQLSDSLSLLSRASALGDATSPLRAPSFQDLDWLWEWNTQPEYFAGQEWKVYAPKQDYIMRQRQLYCANLAGRNQQMSFSSGEFISLLFLTNILSIIIGAGLTYSIILRKATP